MVEASWFIGDAAKSSPKPLSLFIVCKVYETGKIERVAAYFNEETARYEAGQLVGQPQPYGGKSLYPTIALESIEVRDQPPQPA